MTRDLRSAASTARAMLERFVFRYSSSAGFKVAKKFHPPVTSISLVYSVGDGVSVPYVYLRVDTRNVDPDGDATHPMFEFVYLPELAGIIAFLSEDEEAKTPVILPNGRSVECDGSAFVSHVGKALVAELKSFRDQHGFSELPKADKCELFVEEWDSAFAWPEPSDRGKTNLA